MRPAKLSAGYAATRSSTSRPASTSGSAVSSISATAHSSVRSATTKSGVPTVTAVPWVISFSSSTPFSGLRTGMYSPLSPLGSSALVTP